MPLCSYNLRVFRSAHLRGLLLATVAAALSACSAGAEATVTPTIFVADLPLAHPTRTPRPTPVVAEENILDGIQVEQIGSNPFTVRGLSIVRTTADGIEGLGEVLNTTGNAYARTQVRMALHDSAGKTLAENTVLVARSVIGPNEISPFRVHFPSPPIGVHSVSVEAMTGDPVDTSRVKTFVVADVTETKSDSSVIIRGRLPSLTEIVDSLEPIRYGEEPFVTDIYNADDIRPILYTVQAGDTLLGIATKIGVKVDDITTNNPGLLADTLQVGSEIIVRSAGSRVQLTVVAYDRKRRVVGHRIFDLTAAAQTADQTQNNTPFEVVVITFSHDIAESTIIAEVTR